VQNFLLSKNDYLKKIKKGQQVIARGSITNKSNMSYKITPSKYTRLSKNTLNYYTLIIDNSSNWANYPKRSQSIICSIGTEGAGIYSQLGTPHIVMPVTDGKLGICPKEDMWISFNRVLGDQDLQDFCSFIYKVIENLGNALKLNLVTRITDYNYLLYVFDLMDKNKKSYSYMYFPSWFEKYMREDVPLIEYLDSLLKPWNSDFQLVKSFYNDGLSDFEHNEVWTDADCYLIAYDKFMEAVEKA
jgi:hypothetical protein